MIRVLLVDDHPLVRAGLERLLEQTDDMEIAAVADRGEAAITLDSQVEPDVVLMDVSMPGIDGIDCTRTICDSRDVARVVMLTAHTDRERVIGALDAGAIGYLAKDSDPKVLLEGIRSAASGEAPLDPRAAKALLDTRDAGKGPDLTERENEVLALVAEGLANKVIARRLGISERTVKAHLTRVFSELGVTDRTQAALWAMEHGIQGLRG
ncbi:MAG: response regulator [Acidimicrobiales bacterium]